MRICHLTSVHPRYDVRIFEKECRSLAQFYEVYLVVADGNGNEFKENIQIIDAGKKEASRLKRFIKTTRNVYKRAVELNCDVYHFHDPELLFYGWALKRKGKKVIYDIHEDLPKQTLGKKYINPIFRGSIASLIRLVENFIAKRLSALVTVTPSINNRFIKVNQNSYVVNNYPIIKWSSEIISQVKSDHVCYIGAISEIRGIKEVIKAMDHVDVRLDLAGQFDDDQLENEVKNYQGWNKVDYHGVVNRANLFEIMRSCIAGIVTFLPFPNHIDAQPNKLFEYMLAGIPVIASDFPLWREIVEKNNCGICVNPYDVNSISNAIRYLKDNPDIAKEMGDNGRKVVIKKYSWSNEEKKLFELYNSLIH